MTTDVTTGAPRSKQRDPWDTAAAEIYADVSDCHTDTPAKSWPLIVKRACEEHAAEIASERDAFRDALCLIRAYCEPEWDLPLEDGKLSVAEYIDTVLAAHGDGAASAPKRDDEGWQDELFVRSELRAQIDRLRDLLERALPVLKHVAVDGSSEAEALVGEVQGALEGGATRREAREQFERWAKEGDADCCGLPGHGPENAAALAATAHDTGVAASGKERAS